MSSLAWLPFQKRVPFIPQMEMAECGAAALAMVLAYHGHHAPLSEVRQACRVSRDGASGLAILTAARSYELDAEGVALEMEGLDDLPLPAILHWGFRHFVVLERLSADEAILVDPAGGRRAVDMEELRNLFTGVALVFTPGDGFTKRNQARPSLDRYRRVLGEALPSLGRLLGASFLLQLLALVVPVSTQFVVDRVILLRQEELLWAVAWGMSAAVAFTALLKLVRGRVTQSLQASMDFSLMERFVGHLIHLPLHFFLQRTPGDLLQSVQSNTILGALITSRTIPALLDAFMIAGYAWLMLAYSPLLGTVVIGLGVLRAGFLMIFSKRNRQLISAELAASGGESGVLVEVLSTLETIKASGAEQHMIRRWADRMADRMNSNLQRRRIEIASTQFMTFLQGLSVAAVLWIAGHQVLEGKMSVGVLAAFLILQSSFMIPLESLLGAVSQIQRVNGHLHRLDDVLETPPEPSGLLDPGAITGNIELENVGFSYASEGPPVLEDITLKIAPGQTVALVGPTGAGKSTLARLLLGMHVPTSGVIRFDGRDLRDLDLPRLRRQMGVVLQETFFFSDTIRANLSLNDPEIPLEKLRQAAAVACMNEVIEALPEGYETQVRQGGASFSGGERQRLALARALAHEPAALLLDEATSALDRETESRLHANLAGRGVTRVVITHRLATVRDADRIFVMQNGRIVQEGDFETLRAEGGLFAELVRAMEHAHV